MLADYKIIKTVISFIIPYIMLYAIYIQLNGEISPGGGFQAGVIFATAIIGYDLLFGKTKLLKYLSINILIFYSTIGVFIYAGTGVISLFYNENYLNYSALANSATKGQHIGIFMIELGVGITVASVMCLIYLLLQNNETKKKLK